MENFNYNKIIKESIKIVKMNAWIHFIINSTILNVHVSFLL